MADEDLMAFDPTMKKKKKKKKTGFDLDAAMGEDSGSAADVQPTPAPAPVEEEEEEMPATLSAPEKVPDDFSMDFTSMKKKKKKKKAFELDEVGDALPETTESETIQSTVGEAEFNVEDLEFTKKKKKKKKPVNIDGGAEDGQDDEEQIGDDSGSHTAWVGSDRDYTYDELLTRFFDKMREKNPDMIAGEKKKFVMRPPQVLRVGTRKTSFANFADICRLLHRQPKHVLAFLLAELGTSGSVDGNNQLIIRGKYTQKQIENVLRRYIKEYVTCHTCRSRDTLLQKDTRLFFLQCETCGSRCSVASIKTGFQAVTGKRAAIRAKTA
ncbi:eukaryotic translation initiation factor 2 subunit 2-like [Physella acuta]|uniref:eukaryotic translation initiation factor 2 subunit 2-like n=1 Tax=Physella acuta TaxID=109671 RepID=UPI0027DC13F1|nr:eukaryotic translation initiation factor 2 subunit 2-like [Physella acuta]